MHADKILLYFKLYPWLAGFPAAGVALCVLLWRNAVSRDDPGEAQTARLGFLATGLAFVAILAVDGFFTLAPLYHLTIASSVLLMVCVVSVLAGCLGLALIASNTEGRVRTGGLLLSLFAIVLAGFFGFALFAAQG